MIRSTSTNQVFSTTNQALNVFYAFGCRPQLYGIWGLKTLILLPQSSFKQQAVEVNVRSLENSMRSRFLLVHQASFLPNITFTAQNTLNKLKRASPSPVRLAMKIDCRFFPHRSSLSLGPILQPPDKWQLRNIQWKLPKLGKIAY